jgi:beta-lactamase class A
MAMISEEVIATLCQPLTGLNCRPALCVCDLTNGAEIALNADQPVVVASTFKAFVALEFYEQARTGVLDPSERVTIEPAAATPGPTGLSLAQDPATLTLRDLAMLMMSVSDNAATDVLIDRVGITAVQERARTCGCANTHITSDVRTMLADVARELGFSSYRELLDAQAGRHGEDARLRSTDVARVDALSVLDPAQATRTTARDMATFLAAVWGNTAAHPDACADLRSVMAHQVTRRFGPAMPLSGVLAAKSGGLFGRVGNEIAVITYPDGAHYAAAVFTHAHRAFETRAAIDAAMASVVTGAIALLRS